MCPISRVGRDEAASPGMSTGKSVNRFQALRKIKRMILILKRPDDILILDNFYWFLFWGHTRLLSEVTPGSSLRNCSWIEPGLS